MSIRRVLWDAFLKAHGWTLTLVGSAIGVVSWLFPLDATKTVSWATTVRLLVLSGVTVFLSVAILTTALVSALRAARQLPRVVYGTRLSEEKDARLLCLLEPSDLFSFEHQVSFYLRDDETGFERLIGVGRVQNVQQDGKIQAVLEHSDAQFAEVIQKAGKNDPVTLKSLRVKPSVPVTTLMKEPDLNDGTN